MGFFDKKYCDVCGEKIGLLGNRKLEDGNICKNCAARLSPWFDERRHSTLAEIKEQLVYREQNRQAVSSFHMSRSFGNGYQLLMVDEASKTFTVAEKNDLVKGNPDILECSKITSCDTDIQEHRTELKMKDRDGKLVSYNPPRYEYSYDFYCVIAVDHPYFDRMRFKLNSTSVKISNQFDTVNRGFFTSHINTFAPGQADYQKYADMGAEISSLLMSLRSGGSSVTAADGYISVDWQTGLLYHYTDNYGLDVSMSYKLAARVNYKIVNPSIYAAQLEYMTGTFSNAVYSIAVMYFARLDSSGLDPEAVAADRQSLSDYVVNNSQTLKEEFGIEITGLEFAEFELDQSSKALLSQYRSMIGSAGFAQTNAQFVSSQAQREEWICESCAGKNNGGKFCVFCGAPRS